MKYYSEKTKKLYENMNELMEAEAILDKANEEKKLKEKKQVEEEAKKIREYQRRKKQVEQAYEKYIELRNKLNEDYLNNTEYNPLRYVIPWGLMF